MFVTSPFAKYARAIVFCSAKHNKKQQMYVHYRCIGCTAACTMVSESVCVCVCLYQLIKLCTLFLVSIWASRWCFLFALCLCIRVLSIQKTNILSEYWLVVCICFVFKTMCLKIGFRSVRVAICWFVTDIGASVFAAINDDSTVCVG